MSRRQPEHVIHAQTLGARGRLGEGGRTGSLLPGPAAIRRAEHRGPEMPGLAGHEQDLGLARVLHQVIDDVAEEYRLR